MGSECTKTLQNNRLQHQALGIVQLLPNPQGEITRIKLRRPIENPQRFHDWQREMRLLLQEDFTQVFYLPERYEFKQEGMCGNSGVLEVFVPTIQLEFQYYRLTLKSEIATRAHNHMPFYETELWYLLYNILQAAFLMEPLGRRIGDLHPSNIVLNDKGRVKIVPSCLFPGSQNSYQKMVESQENDAYLAPEEIDETLLQRGIYPNVQPCKAQVFSIGLTILMAASLLDSYDLYDRPFLTFNPSKKRQHFNEVAVSYSTYFCSILNQLLQQNPQKRRTASDFFRQLNRFQDDILSFREFNLIENKLREGMEKDRMEDDEASIAELLTQRDQRELRETQTSIIQNFKSF